MPCATTVHGVHAVWGEHSYSSATPRRPAFFPTACLYSRTACSCTCIATPRPPTLTLFAGLDPYSKQDFALFWWLPWRAHPFMMCTQPLFTRASTPHICRCCGARQKPATCLWLPCTLHQGAYRHRGSCISCSMSQRHLIGDNGLSGQARLD